MKIHTPLLIFKKTLSRWQVSTLVAGAALLSASLLASSPAPIKFDKPALRESEAVWVALRVSEEMGSMIIHPGILLGDDSRSDRLFLPFHSDLLVRKEATGTQRVWVYRDFAWHSSDPELVQLNRQEDGWSVRLAQESTEVRSWRSFIEANEILAVGEKHFVRKGEEVFLPFYWTIDNNGEWVRRAIYGRPEARPRVYQMLPRLFGNTNETRKINGTLEENGVGKFSDMCGDVFRQFRQEGFTHIWVTGVLQQATSTDYSEIGEPADDPDLLKGIAGSPYAIRDYFDVSPDYADDPVNRREEFRQLLDRAEEEGIKIVIDLVANHVARSYNSTVRPDLTFGNNDRTDLFFHPENNFFYLTPDVVRDGTSAPLILPTIDPETGKVISETARIVGGADGLFDPETRFGRVTGNNIVSWQPSIHDWYETVKLNFGLNFLEPHALPSHPSVLTPDTPIPDTWFKMDEIIAYWQEMGVDGFRADMAHMIPPEFWKWAINRARARDPEVFFFAEAYDDDPARVRSREDVFLPTDGAMIALLDAGFHSVYDDPTYDILEYLYEDRATANDLDRAQDLLGPFFFDAAIRYMENHDEPRIAHPLTFGGNGKEIGRPLTALVYGLSRGPVMLYHGQEIGEPATGASGFGGDDTRTTIFDYWSMPEFNKWWNDGARDGGRLSPGQRDLRAWYVRLLHAAGEPAFSMGNFYALNPVNAKNPFYGRITDLGESGHWLYSYIRHDPESGDRILVVINLHPKRSLDHQRLRLSREQWESIGLTSHASGTLRLTDILESDETVPFFRDLAEARREGIYLESLAPLAAHYFRVEEVAGSAERIDSVPLFFTASTPRLGASPVFRLRSGEERVIDLRRLGNTGPSHRFEVGAVEGVSLSLDDANLMLRVKPEPGLKGLKQLPLKLVPDEWMEGDGDILKTTVLLGVESLPVTRFTATAPSGSTVSVVGDFNGWNQNADRLEEFSPGQFARELFLPSGRYRYKFVINDRFTEDRNATQREPDGFGGYNSIVVVAADRNDQKIPTLTFLRQDENILIFKADTDLSAGKVYADELDAENGVRKLPVQINGSQIKVDVAGLGQGARVRLVAQGPAGDVGREAIAVVGDSHTHLWERDIIYYAFTDRFRDGDPTNNDPIHDAELADIANYKGGDFTGIHKSMTDGYFEKLGISVLWLAPLYQNPEEAWREYLPPYRKYSGYHGYWPVSLTEVERRFGGETALRKLMNEANERNIRILADLVLKHVHMTNPVYIEKPELFGNPLAADGEPNLRRWNTEPFSTLFEPFLPGFDFTNPTAQKFLIENTLYWLNEFSLSGFRLDAVKHIHPDFWWRFRAAIDDAFPQHNFYFVGETFHDREGIMDFVGPSMLDGQFDFPLYDAIMDVFARQTDNFHRLDSALKQSELIYGRTARMSPLLGNHDKARFMAYADGDLPDPDEPDPEEVAWLRPPQVDDENNYNKLKLAATFLYSIDGVPTLYYGDEIGKSGAGDPDNRRMMRFDSDLTKAEQKVLKHFSILGQTRRAHPALYLGSRKTLLLEEDRYALIRRYGDDIAIVAFNQSERPTTMFLQVGEIYSGVLFKDVLSGDQKRVNNGRLTLHLPPMTSALYLRP